MSRVLCSGTRVEKKRSSGFLLTCWSFSPAAAKCPSGHTAATESQAQDVSSANLVQCTTDTAAQSRLAATDIRIRSLCVEPIAYHCQSRQRNERAPLSLRAALRLVLCACDARSPVYIVTCILSFSSSQPAVRPKQVSQLQNRSSEDTAVSR